MRIKTGFLEAVDNAFLTKTPGGSRLKSPKMHLDDTCTLIAFSNRSRIVHNHSRPLSSGQPNEMTQSTDP